jgi:hypothetical protein
MHSSPTHAFKRTEGFMISMALLRYAARRAEVNVDRLSCEDRAAATARAILSIATSRSHVEALRAITVYLRDGFEDERRQAVADRELADA